MGTTASAESPSPGRWEGDGRGDRGEVSGRGDAPIPQCYDPPPSAFDLMEVSSLMESTQKQAWMGTLGIVLAAAVAVALPTVLTGAPKGAAPAAAVQLPPGAEMAAKAIDR